MNKQVKEIEKPKTERDIKMVIAWDIVKGLVLGLVIGLVLLLIFGI